MAKDVLVLNGDAILQELQQQLMKVSVEYHKKIKSEITVEWNTAINQITNDVQMMGVQADTSFGKFHKGLSGAGSAIAAVGDACTSLHTEMAAVCMQEELCAKAAELMEDPLGSIGAALSDFGSVCLDVVAGLAVVVSAVGTVLEMYDTMQRLSGVLLASMNSLSGGAAVTLGSAFGSLATQILPVVGILALIAAAIAGLIVGFQYLYENNTAFRDQVNSLFTSIQTHVEGVISGLIIIIHALYTEGVQPIVESTKLAFEELWNNGLAIFIENVSIFCLQLVEMILSIWDNAINPFINLMLEIFLPVFTQVWDALLAIAVPVIERIMEYVNLFIEILNVVMGVLNEHVWPIFQVVFDGLSQAVQGFWEFVQPVFAWFNALLSNVVDFALAYFLAPLDLAFQSVVAIIQNIADPIGNVFDGIKGTFQGIISFVTGIFSGDWSKAWNGVKSIFEGVWNTLGSVVETVWGVITSLFSNGGQIFSGVVDGIAGAFAAIVNTMIRGINGVIAFPFQSINSILNGVRDISVMGIAPFSFIPYNALPVPQIPELAKGGIVTQPTLAMIGERGKEAVLPLERNTSWMDELAQKSYGVQSDDAVRILLQKILARLEEMNLQVDLDGEIIYRNQERLRTRKGLRFSNL